MASIERRISTRKGAAIVRWLARWSVLIDGRRQQRAQMFATRAEALAAAGRMESLVEARAVRDESRITFRVHAEEWLTECRRTLKVATVRGYEGKVASVMPYLGALPLRSITARQIEHAIAEASENSRSGRILSASTARHIRVVISNCLRAAERWERIVTNPGRNVRTAKPERVEKLWPSAKEVSAMLQAAPEPWRTLIAIATATGMRRGEILGLAWDAIDFDGRWMHVRQVVEQAGRAETAKVRAGAKNVSSVRRIALGDTVLALLRQHRAREAALALACGAPLPGDGFLFHGREGFRHHLTPSAATAKVARIAYKAGVRPGVQPLHGLRHAFGSRLMGALPDTAIAKLMGHGDARITRQIYQHMDEQAERDAARIVEGVVGNLLPTGRGRR